GGQAKKSLMPLSRHWLIRGYPNTLKSEIRNRFMELSRCCIPYTPLKRDLKDCRIGLVSTSGAYVEGTEPFTDNDLSFRLIPKDTDTKKIHFVPGHFDTSKGALDANIMFPLDWIREMLAAGEIRKITYHHVSMGLTT